MITFDNVSMHYNSGVSALEDVSFEIKDGDFVFLVGPSGAGKTTILRLILRELTPSTGTVAVDEFVPSEKSFKDIHKLRRSMGVIFQDFKILPDKNVRENISMSLKVSGYSNQYIKEEVERALELVGLPEKMEMFPMQLSAGEQQRVAIARAIVGERKIILADEPTGNLDPKTSWEIMKIFKKLEKTKTIILATHNADIVNSMQRRVIVMKGGKLAKDMKKGGYDF